jgi:hypothetical protein
MAVIGKDIMGMKADELLTFLEQKKKTLKDANRPRHDIIKLCYEYYRSTKEYLPEKMRDKKGKPNYVSPKPDQQIEVVTSFMLGNRPHVFCEAFPGVPTRKVAIAQMFLNDVVWGKWEINYEHKMDLAERWREIGGTSIQKNLWRRKFREEKVPIEIWGIRLPFSTTKQVMTKNAPDVKVVNPLRFFPDPLVEELRDMECFCEEVPMRLSEIKANGLSTDFDGKPTFENTDKITEDMLRDAEKNEVVRDWISVAGLTEKEEEAKDSHDPSITVEEWWLSPDILITIVPGKLLLRRKKYPDDDPPYTACRFKHEPGMFWGVGLLERLIPTFDMRNEYVNLELARAKRTYGMLMIYNPSFFHDLNDIVPKEAWSMKVKDINKAVRFENLPQNNSLMDYVAMFDREVEVDGVPNYMSGANSDKFTDTTTGIQQLTGQASMKYEKPRGRLENATEEVIERIARQCGKHLIDGREFYTDEQGNLTKNYIDYSFFEDAQGNPLFRVRIEVGSTHPVNDVSEERKALLMQKEYGQDPYINPVELRIRNLKLLGVSDPKGLINEIPQVAMPAAQAEASKAYEKGKQEKVGLEMENKMLKEQIKAMKGRGEQAKETVAGMLPPPPVNQEAEQLKVQIAQASGAQNG